MRALTWAVGLLCAGALACSPTAPPPPGPNVPTQPHFPVGTVLSFTSGETGQPVGGATVLIAGTGASAPFERTFLTDAGGRIVLDAPLLRSPEPAVDVSAAGFLKRETLLRTPYETTFTLWPSTSPTGLDEAFTGMVVYSSARCPARLDRRFIWRHHPSTQEVTVVLGASLHTATDIERHQQAIDALNAATGSAPRYVLSLSAPSTGVVFRATVEPSRCPSAQVAAFVTLAGLDRYFTGGDIVYCAEAYARLPRIIAHELGHTTGLHHSDVSDTTDVMSCISGFAPWTFSPREVLAMKLMRQRRGGNEWPDRDRVMLPTALASAAPTTTTIVCPR